MKAFIPVTASTAKQHSFIAMIIFLCSSLALDAQVITINQTFSSDTILTPFTGATAPVLNLNNCDFQDNQRGLYLNGFREIGEVDIKNNQFYLAGANRPEGRVGEGSRMKKP
ncbi:MAG: hypothetical protein ABIJ04_04450 [Bacteroidota bacterium]